MGTVKDDEFCHHLRVMNCKQPRYGPTPVVTDETTSVVPLKEKKTRVRRRSVIAAEENSVSNLSDAGC